MDDLKESIELDQYTPRLTDPRSRASSLVFPRNYQHNMLPLGLINQILRYRSRNPPDSRIGFDWLLHPEIASYIPEQKYEEPEIDEHFLRAICNDYYKIFVSGGRYKAYVEDAYENLKDFIIRNSEKETIYSDDLDPDYSKPNVKTFVRLDTENIKQLQDYIEEYIHALEVVFLDDQDLKVEMLRRKMIHNARAFFDSVNQGKIKHYTAKYYSKKSKRKSRKSRR